MDESVRFFVGHSCEAHCRATDMPAGHDENAVEFYSARWNASSNTMCALPRLSKVRLADFSHARDLDSIFSVVWTWTGGYDRTAVSAHGTKLGTVGLGLEVFAMSFSAVAFNGNELFAEIKRYNVSIED